MDNILMRIMDVFLAIPQNLMAISIVAALGMDLKNLMIALTISNVPRFARIVRSAICKFVVRNSLRGGRPAVPGMCALLQAHSAQCHRTHCSQATLSIGHTIIAIAGLSFIGLGIQPPKPEWGTMLAEAKTHEREYPYLIMFPVAIMVTVLALNLMGDGL